jgi:hypothetical protein
MKSYLNCYKCNNNILKLEDENIIKINDDDYLFICSKCSNYNQLIYKLVKNKYSNRWKKLNKKF